LAEQKAIEAQQKENEARELEEQLREAKLRVCFFHYNIDFFFNKKIFSSYSRNR
jgi:hypothetical protein